MHQSLLTSSLVLAIASQTFVVEHTTVGQEPESVGLSLSPTEVDYQKNAFYPDRWRASNVDFDMLAWEGKHVVFLTKKGEYDPEILADFVRRLDDGWQIYLDVVGRSPRLFKQINEKPTICALPQSNLSCGYGCGFVGATGIEASAFHSVDLPAFKKQPNSFQHYYFYEMGRNFFVYGDRHSLFTTGYAVFMRNVCMDRMRCIDRDLRTRKTIESCEEVYANSQVAFFDAFTNLGSGEKQNRLRDTQGKLIAPSDQPVMYATAMLKLRKDLGDDWVDRFYKVLLECEPARATDIESAKPQCFAWLVSASVAARKDLTNVFVDRWRLPFNAKQRKIMEQVNWKDQALAPSPIVRELLSVDRTP